MKIAVSLIAALALAPSLSHAQSKPPRGTIAVIPFGAQGPTMTETASALAVAVENALDKSGRFVAVLPRTGDAAIKAEIAKSTEPTSLASVVQIAQDAQLNANYVLSGWVVAQEAKTTSDGRGGTGNTAEARVLVRIVDVSTGAMVVSDIVTLSSGPKLDVCGDGFSGAACRTKNLVMKKWTYPTPAEAINSIRTSGNAEMEIQQALTQKFGYVVLDMTEEGGKPQLIIRAGGGEPKKGTKLQAAVSKTSAMTGASYNQTLGKLEVVDVSGDVATANITEGADKILDALKKQQAVLILKN
jgi:hypothetical protein